MLWIVVIAEALAAGIVQSITGFGAGVIMMLVLPYLLDVVQAAALAAFVCGGLTVVLAWQYRKYVNWRVLLPLLAAYTGAQSLTVYLLKSIDLSGLSIAFGLFLILLAVFYSFISRRVTVKPHWYIGVLISALSGISGGLFGFGPMVALYLLPVTDSREEYIGSTQMLFAAANVANVAARIGGGLFPAALTMPAVAGIGGILVGKSIGLGIGSRIDKEKLSRLVYGFIALSGVIMIVKQFL